MTSLFSSRADRDAAATLNAISKSQAMIEFNLDGTIITANENFLGAMGYLFFINGLQRLPVSVFAVLDYTALIWASLLGFIFYAELPGAQVWVGGALIITACVLTAQSVPKPAPVAPVPPA